MRCQHVRELVFPNAFKFQSRTTRDDAREEDPSMTRDGVGDSGKYRGHMDSFFFFEIRPHGFTVQGNCNETSTSHDLALLLC